MVSNGHELFILSDFQRFSSYATSYTSNHQNI